MTTRGSATTGPGRGAGRRMALAAAVVATATLAGACASEADPDEVGSRTETGAEAEANVGAGAGAATASFLAQASQQTAAEAYRVEQAVVMRAEAGGESVDVDAVVLTGEQDGESYQYTMDMGEMFTQMEASIGAGLAGSGLDVEDLRMEMAGNAEELFIRGPMFAAYDELGATGPGGEGFGELAELGDRWGRVDLTQLGESWAGAGMTGVLGQGANSTDPQEVLRMLGGTGEVQDLGTDEIDGAQVTGMGTTLSLRDLMAAQGMDEEEWLDQLGAGGGADLDEAMGMSAMLDGMLEAEIPFEVWADGDGNVRRIAYEMDMATILGDLLSQLPASDDGVGEESAVPGEFMVGARIDLSDHGDPGIEIELPDAAEAVDITDTYAASLGGG